MSQSKFSSPFPTIFCRFYENEAFCLLTRKYRLCYTSSLPPPPDLDISFSTTDPYDQHTPDFYVPFFTIIEFLSYLGWIKVAETLLNPFGEDDEDFQINYLIDRNLQGR